MTLTVRVVVAPPAIWTFALTRRRPARRAIRRPLLDSLTDGGLGAALLWPLSTARFFAPWTPIPVAPIGGGMLSARGLYVALTEVALFSPLLVYAVWPRRQRRG